MRKSWGVGLWLLCLMAPLGAFAQEVSALDGPAMSFDAREVCSDKGKCEIVALGAGTIKTETLDDFKVFLLKHPEVSKVYLHSMGGHLVSGMQLGLMFRLMGLDTAMTPKMRCMSACAYAFMGGVSREMQPGALIGVHRFYSESGKATEEDGQVMLSQLGEYVSAMGVSTEILTLATRAGRNEFVGIQATKAVELNLDNHAYRAASWHLSLEDGAATMSATGQAYGSDRAVVVSMGRVGKSVLLALVLKEPAFHSKLRLAREMTSNFLLVCRHSKAGEVDPKSCIKGVLVQNWKESEEGVYLALFSIDTKSFRKLLEGSSEDGVVFTVLGGENTDRVLMFNTKASGLKNGFKSLD